MLKTNNTYIDVTNPAVLLVPASLMVFVFSYYSFRNQIIHATKLRMNIPRRVVSRVLWVVRGNKM